MRKFRLFLGLTAASIILWLYLQAFLPEKLFLHINALLYHLLHGPSENITDKFDSRFPYHYIISPQGICKASGAKEFFLLIVVVSAIPNHLERRAIRETWGHDAYENRNEGSVRLIFLVGTSSDPIFTTILKEEARIHQDVIQVNIHDSYQNLTLKTITLLKWVNDNCPNVLYVLKSDDDMYVNVQNLVNQTQEMETKTNVIFGYLLKNARPFRDNTSKWFVPYSQYPRYVYPDFLSGTAYVMSRDTIPVLYETCLNTTFLVLEDVFVTGICAEKAGIKRMSISGFTNNKRSSTGCAFQYAITGHDVAFPEMWKIYKELKNNHLTCG